MVAWIQDLPVDDLCDTAIELHRQLAERMDASQRMLSSTQAAVRLATHDCASPAAPTAFHKQLSPMLAMAHQKAREEASACMAEPWTTAFARGLVVTGAYEIPTDPNEPTPAGAALVDDNHPDLDVKARCQMAELAHLNATLEVEISTYVIKSVCQHLKETGEARWATQILWALEEHCEW